MSVSVRDLAEQKYASGDYASAVELYQESLRAEGPARTLHRPLGLALTSLKRYEEAIPHCQEAIALQPTDADIRYALGFCYGGMGQFDSAIHELDTVLSLQPNHVQASQVLSHCLVEKGKSQLEIDPRAAEECFARASKLAPGNHQITALLLNTLVTSGQKGKPVEMYKNFSSEQKASPLIGPVIEKMQQDPNFQTLIKQVDVRQSGASVIEPTRPTNSVDMVKCTNCGQMIVSYAAICPYCNFKFRATGTFAGRDTGPDHEWQEIAYTILSVIYTAYAGFNSYVAWTTMDVGMRGFFTTIFVVETIIGLGMVFRLQWIMFVAKIMCYITLLQGAYLFMVTFFLGHYLGAGMAVLTMAIAGFMVYLINYVGD